MAARQVVIKVNRITQKVTLKRPAPLKIVLKRTGIRGGKGDPGLPGLPGVPGPGLAPGGIVDQIPVKLSGTDYHVGWVTFTKAMLGLGNVPNVDATLRSNHTGTQEADTVTYDNPAATTVSVGGIPAGTVFADTPVKDILDDLFYPFQAPSFSSFAMSGQATPVEVGTTISGSKTFTWASTNAGNVAAGSVHINDGATVLASGLGASGPTTAGITSTQLTAPGSHSWSIAGLDMQGGSLSRNFTVSWYWRIYYGAAAAATLNEAAIEALTGQLAASGFGTFAMPSSNYKYLCYPATLAAASSFTDTLTSLPVDMADATDDAAYSNTANGFSYALVSVTNTLGITTNYRVYRTKYQLGSSINIGVA
jgi:hypothetical protein